MMINAPLRVIESNKRRLCEFCNKEIENNEPVMFCEDIGKFFHKECLLRNSNNPSNKNHYRHPVMMNFNSEGQHEDIWVTFKLIAKEEKCQEQKAA